MAFALNHSKLATSVILLRYRSIWWSFRLKKKYGCWRLFEEKHVIKGKQKGHKLSRTKPNCFVQLHTFFTRMPKSCNKKDYFLIFCRRVLSESLNLLRWFMHILMFLCFYLFASFMHICSGGPETGRPANNPEVSTQKVISSRLLLPRSKTRWMSKQEMQRQVNPVRHIWRKKKKKVNTNTAREARLEIRRYRAETAALTCSCKQAYV